MPKATSERDPSKPRPRSLHHIDDEDYDDNGNYKPVEKVPEVKASETPVGVAPLKNDEPDHRSKKEKKAEEKSAKPAEEENASEAVSTPEAKGEDDKENNN